MHGVAIAVAGVALALFAIGCIPLYRTFWRGPSRLRDWAINLSTLFVTIAALLVAVEAWFYWGSIQSDGFEFTLSSQRWNQLYGGPINSLGYRDHDYDLEPKVGSKLLLVVGDSFANGNGIRDYRNRFSGVLAGKLGAEWDVRTVARGGWDTPRELKELQSYPVKPDVVVLQYYLNDIKHAVLARGLQMIPEPPKPARMLQPLVNHSYAANAIYWRMFRVVEYAQETFWDHLSKYYEDESLWSEHEHAIRAFVDYTKSQDIRLFVVIFPNLTNVNESLPLTAKVASAFSDETVTPIDLGPLLTNRTPGDMVVNSFDAHPNEHIHAEVAEVIYTAIQSASKPSTSPEAGALP